MQGIDLYCQEAAAFVARLAADVATWRARLQAARAADSAPTVASLVAALLPTPEAADEQF